MCYQPELATPPDAGQRMLFAGGAQVGALARQLHPDGVLVEEPAFRHDQAAAWTEGLLRTGPSALYEAAFTAAGVRVRTDILRRVGASGWDLIEVKSSTSVKEEHLPDAAVQLVTLEQAGLRIDNVAVAHVNSEYVYDGEGYIPAHLFTVEDVTREVAVHAPAVPDQLAALRDVLALDHAPERELASYCKNPYACEFLEHCRSREPEWTIEDLPRIDDQRRRTLRELGAHSIHEIPATFRLTPTQERVRQAVVSGRPYVSSGLERELARISSTAHFIDFETIAPALPIYAGTRPYQVQPFQWSDHIVRPDGSVEHHEFLGDGRTDPRREFAETLLDRLSDAGTIVVYSSFEQTRIRQLQESFPDLYAPLQNVLDRPWVDLLKVVRDHYYHPNFRGSYSIKSVLPALVPDFGYDDLDIHDGSAASAAHLESLTTTTTEERRQTLREQLVAYCGRDTEAMVRVVEALRRN